MTHVRGRSQIWRRAPPRTARRPQGGSPPVNFVGLHRALRFENKIEVGNKFKSKLRKRELGGFLPYSSTNPGFDHYRTLWQPLYRDRQKRHGCLLSYSQAEPGRELTQPRKHLLAEPCTFSSLPPLARETSPSRFFAGRLMTTLHVVSSRTE